MVIIYGIDELNDIMIIDMLRYQLNYWHVQVPVKLERENNLKEYKTAHGVDLQPKFGAGSEFGREAKDEARRKKYGIIKKRYNPNNQPWLMKVGKNKDASRFVFNKNCVKIFV